MNRSKAALLFALTAFTTAMLSSSGQAASGTVIVVENTGSASFTHVVLWFDAPPTDTAQTHELVVGDRTHPNARERVGYFSSGGRDISERRPLAPGGIACTRPIRELVAGSMLEYDEVHTPGGGGFSHGLIYDGFKEITPDETVLYFDVANGGSEGGRSAGTLRFISGSGGRNC